MATNGTSSELNHCGTNGNITKCRKWDISNLLSHETQSQSKYAVLVLNRPIIQNQEFLTNLWNNATVRITVDGGTNRWEKFLSQLPENVLSNIKYPDIVSGDFDSIRPEVLQKYKDIDCCEVIHTPDQMHTDFTKALMELDTWCKSKQTDIEDVVIVCQCSGRLDQIFGNIQTLFLVKEKSLLPPAMNIYIITEDSMTWLLHPGDHVISIPDASRKHRAAWCSLVPVGEKCTKMTTTGLKWNLDDSPLQFGEIVSTSNTFDGSDVVTVKCSNSVLWSMIVPCVIGKR